MNLFERLFASDDELRLEAIHRRLERLARRLAEIERRQALARKLREGALGQPKKEGDPPGV